MGGVIRSLLAATRRLSTGVLGLFLASSAAAQEAAPEEPVGDAVEATDHATSDAEADPTPADVPTSSRPLKPYKIGGVVVPLFQFNSTDGAGLGLGVEVFDRKRGADVGYRHRVSAWTYWTTSGNYSSNYLQYEYRGEQLLVARLTYRFWRDMFYVGSGGDDVGMRWDDAVRRGNDLEGPSALVTGLFPIPATPIYVFTQAYGRFALSTPEVGSLLADRAQAGDAYAALGSSFYLDTSVGLAIQEVDQWPVPNKGVRFEGSARFGGTAGVGAFEPLAGVNVELIGWWPLVGKYLTIGGRGVFDKTWGRRPWYEQEWLGGQFRDENAYEQMLTGYARSRTRGDGVAAGLVELRTFMGRTRHPFLDVGFYLSAYAEAAWLFDGDDPGPFMPTVGVSPQVLWQGAVQLRPFVSIGWLADAPGLERTPEAVFGISILDPL